MSVSLFSFDFVAPPPSVCFTLCIVYVWSSCCVYRNIDFLVFISCSRRQLSCPLSVYFDICDYLDSDLCLFYNDFCLAPLNFFFTSLCNWVRSFASPLPHVTGQTYSIPISWLSSSYDHRYCFHWIWLNPYLVQLNTICTWIVQYYKCMYTYVILPCCPHVFYVAILFYECRILFFIAFCSQCSHFLHFIIIESYIEEIRSFLVIFVLAFKAFI